MKKLLFTFVCLAVVLVACGPAATTVPTPTATATLVPTSTETPTSLPTATPTATATPSYPPEGYGPANFPADVDPLTGLTVADPTLLRPPSDGHQGPEPASQQPPAVGSFIG